LTLGGRTGTYTLEYSFGSPVKTVTQSMTITAGTASRLVMVQQPQGPFAVGDRIGRASSGGALSAECPPGSTKIAGGDCVVEFRSGTVTWNKPYGVSTASGLIVGGGGGGGGHADGGGGGP
jgi:hypothetical protein